MIRPLLLTLSAVLLAGHTYFLIAGMGWRWLSVANIIGLSFNIVLILVTPRLVARAARRARERGQGETDVRRYSGGPEAGR